MAMQPDAEVVKYST